MGKRIFITGCAKSGTTLMQRLFLAFEDVEVIEGEISLDNFVKRFSKKRYLVGKRTNKTIFSRQLAKDVLIDQAYKIINHRVMILNMVRDGRDVIESEHGYVTCHRWIESMKQARDKYRKLIHIIIPYERLVDDPDLIQKEISWNIDLKSKHKFSDYPTFVPEAFFNITGEKPGYEARAIDTARVGKDPALYKGICPPELMKDFEDILSGYPAQFRGSQGFFDVPDEITNQPLNQRAKTKDAPG